MLQSLYTPIVYGQKSPNYFPGEFDYDRVTDSFVMNKSLILPGNSLRLGNHIITENIEEGDDGFQVTGTFHIEKHADGTAGSIEFHEGDEPTAPAMSDAHRFWVDADHNIKWQDNDGNSHILHTGKGNAPGQWLVNGSNIYYSAGNVGIKKVPAAGYALDVEGKIRASGVITALSGNSTNWNSAYTHISSDGSSHSFINQDVTTTGNPTYATLSILGDLTVGTNVFFIDVSNGSINLGSAVTGTDRLNVFSPTTGVQTGIASFYDSSSNIKFRIRDEWTASSIPPRIESHSSLGFALNNTTNAPFVWYINGTGNEKMRLTTTGLGIGTTTPNFRIDAYINRTTGIVRSARFQTDGNHVDARGISIWAGEDTELGTNYWLEAYDGNGGTLTGGLRSVAGVFDVFNSSDERLKQNIRDTKIIGRDIINSLIVRDFEWKRNPGCKVIGFIAQEVMEVYPDAVGKPDPETNMYGMSKTALIPPMIKYMQELEMRITKLEGN